MKVKDIMSNKIISIKPTGTLTDASKLMRGNHISCLPIMEDEKVIGIITTTDLVNIYTSADKEQHMDPWSPVSKFMSSPVVTINLNEDIKVASKIMNEKKFHHLIVTDNNKTFIGVISSLDIARALN
jgi:CBS domain-containing protein